MAAENNQVDGIAYYKMLASNSIQPEEFSKIMKEADHDWRITEKNTVLTQNYPTEVKLCLSFFGSSNVGTNYRDRHTGYEGTYNFWTDKIKISPTYSTSKDYYIKHDHWLNGLIMVNTIKPIDYITLTCELYDINGNYTEMLEIPVSTERINGLNIIKVNKWYQDKWIPMSFVKVKYTVFLSYADGTSDVLANDNPDDVNFCTLPKELDPTSAKKSKKTIITALLIIASIFVPGFSVIWAIVCFFQGKKGWAAFALSLLLINYVVISFLYN